MRNTDTTQLERARAVVEAREQRLAGELRELSRERQAAEQTLAQLNGYLDEYAGADREGGGRARSPRELVNGRDFVKRLGTAIAGQDDRARRLADRVAGKLAQWQRARADLAAIDRVIDNRRRAARESARRREQREADATAARPRPTLASPADPEPRSPASSTIRVEPST